MSVFKPLMFLLLVMTGVIIISGSQMTLAQQNVNGSIQLSRYSTIAIKQQWPVKRGDTLWHITQSLLGKGSDNLYPLMDALFQLNPHAFIQNNRHCLKSGAVIMVPDAATLLAFYQTHAVRSATKTSQRFTQGVQLCITSL